MKNFFWRRSLLARRDGFAERSRKALNQNSTRTRFYLEKFQACGADPYSSLFENYLSLPHLDSSHAHLINLFRGFTRTENTEGNSWGTGTVLAFLRGPSQRLLCCR